MAGKLGVIAENDYPPPPPEAPPSPGPAAAGGSPDEEEDMTAVVEKLAGFLQTQDITAEDDAETADLISKISEQITTMMEEQKSPLGTEESDGGYQLATTGSLRAGGTANVPATELPSYPTPYEVWKKKHEVVEEPRTPVVLGEPEWGDLVERLNDSSKNKQTLLMRKQHQQIAEELSNLTFTPSISTKSRELAANVEGLPERLEALLHYRKEKLTAQRADVQKRTMDLVTAKPDLKTPCVCGKGKGISMTPNGQLSGHSPFCLNFMRACQGVNKSSRIQRETQKMRRKVSHLTQYDADRKTRLQQRRTIIRDAQDRELTFSPQLNKNSLALANKISRDGRDPSKSFRITGSHQDAGHAEETFVPQINHRSKAISRGGKNVYDRLYTSAKQRILADREAMAREMEESLRHNATSSSAAKLLPPGTDGAATRRAFVRPKPSIFAPVAGAEPGDPEYVNEVEFSQDLDFIVQRFAV